MTNVIHLVENTSKESFIKIKRALISVSDKTGILEIGTFLTTNNIEILSTGGTAKILKDAKIPVIEVSSYTNFPEIMNGRVKTLHPKIHGGLLNIRDNINHKNQMIEHHIESIDLLVVNLYPFDKIINNINNNYDICIENIDIGGPSMLRSAAKNHKYVTVLTNPLHYNEFIQEMNLYNNKTSLNFRIKKASEAFILSSNYELTISNWFLNNLNQSNNKDYKKDDILKDKVIDTDKMLEDTIINKNVNRQYNHEFNLKYGCNPHQIPSSIYSINNNGLPFTVLNGSPGYINLLDALNAIQLVMEIKETIQLPAATSFKHVSPAGVGLGLKLNDSLKNIYEVSDLHDSELTSLCCAYIRARNTDPLSSYGDFIALSDKVDIQTAKYIKKEVSDGIIAPDYDKDAYDILKSKKNSHFIILKSEKLKNNIDMEYREINGAVLGQKKNNILFNINHLKNIKTNNKDILNDPSIINDLILAAITLKYTQSNSIGYAKNGQMIGIGAGQQSRVDCIKLAGIKLKTWFLRFHPKVLNLKFKKSIKKQDRINARVRYIEGDLTKIELETFNSLFEEIPILLNENEKNIFLNMILDGVSLASDAFFPFRDSIDIASKFGVKYITQPGGSNRDNEVIEACNEYNISMSFSNLRLFHH